MSKVDEHVQYPLWTQTICSKKMKNWLWDIVEKMKITLVDGCKKLPTSMFKLLNDFIKPNPVSAEHVLLWKYKAMK
jgi:hypothetical protein